MSKKVETLNEFNPYMKGTALAEFDWLKDKMKHSGMNDIKLMREGFALPPIRGDIESYIKWKFNITEKDLEDDKD